MRQHTTVRHINVSTDSVPSEYPEWDTLCVQHVLLSIFQHRDVELSTRSLQNLRDFIQWYQTHKPDQYMPPGPDPMYPLETLKEYCVLAKYYHIGLLDASTAIRCVHHTIRRHQEWCHTLWLSTI